MFTYVLVMCFCDSPQKLVLLPEVYSCRRLYTVLYSVYTFIVGILVLPNPIQGHFQCELYSVPSDSSRMSLP